MSNQNPDDRGDGVEGGVGGDPPEDTPEQPEDTPSRGDGVEGGADG